MKQKELSLWLRAVVILVALAVLFLAVVFVPDMGEELARQNPNLDFMYMPCLIYVWVTVLPVAAALVLSWLIFTDIGRDNSFSAANAARLKGISILALADTALYILAAFLLAFFHALHPGILVVIVCVVFMGISLTVAAAALSHLTRKAALLKSENDLTI